MFTVRKLFWLCAVVAVAGLCMACATTKVAYGDTADEMSVAMTDRNVMKNVHYSAEEVRDWHVLVLNTENTARTLAALDKMRLDLTKYKNYEAANDCDKRAALGYQNAWLEKIFKYVSYESKAEESYDLILLRDYEIHFGTRSGDVVQTTLLYWMVYPVTEGMPLGAEKEFIRRGVFAAHGECVIPYPATACGIQESNEQSVMHMFVQLTNGFELYALNGVGAQHFSGTAAITAGETVSLPAAATTDSSAKTESMAERLKKLR